MFGRVLYKWPAAAVVAAAGLFLVFTLYSASVLLSDCSFLNRASGDFLDCIDLFSNRFGSQHSGFWIALGVVTTFFGIAFAAWQNFKLKKREFTLSELKFLDEDEYFRKCVQSIIAEFPREMSIVDVEEKAEDQSIKNEIILRFGGGVSGRFEHLAMCVLTGDLENHFIKKYLSDYILWIAPIVRFIAIDLRGAHPDSMAELEHLYALWFGLPKRYEDWTDALLERARADRRKQAIDERYRRRYPLSSMI